MTLTKLKVQIKLKKYEHIIAVVPEYCAGPGWSNAVLWVHIADGNTGKYRTESIQPDERNRDQHVNLEIKPSKGSVKKVMTIQIPTGNKHATNKTRFFY